MTKIASDIVIVKNSDEEIFNFLLDMNNFKQLLPQEKISEWESSTQHCSFRIQGAVIIPLVLQSSEPNKHIHIISGDKAPFPFTLDIYITSNSALECSGNLIFEGQMNPFIRLMAEKPLTNLFNYIAKKLVEVKSIA